jgi:Uma2 family endonuclease
MASLPIKRYTPEEYLAIERAAEFKSEYISGEMIAMAGTTRRHVLISGNIFRHLGNQLDGTPCETYANELRVQALGAYFYPDVAVACGDIKLLDDTYLDTLINPTIVVEVLSKSTEGHDRGTKFMRYGAIASLKDYILVAQDQIRVEHFTRIGDREWSPPLVLTKPDEVLEIESIGCRLTLTQIYDRVKFEE